MGTDARGHTAPTSGETPKRSALNDLSLSINDVVPVANATARNTLLSNVGATSDRPLIVVRTDTKVVEGSWGSGFYALTERPLSVLKSGTPADKALASSSTVDLIAAGDTGGIPSITIDPGGRIKLDIAFEFVAATASTAAGGTLSLLVDGTVSGTAWLVHTGLSGDANGLKAFVVTLDGWLTPATAHTVNARLTWTGGGGISLKNISYAVRG